MAGKWHIGSDRDQRTPVDFGFDEGVWSPRTADEVMWTMQRNAHAVGPTNSRVDR